MTDLPLLCPTYWPTVRRDAAEALAVLRAHPRARPPRAVVMMLLDHHLSHDEPTPTPVLEALAVALTVSDYGPAHMRKAALRRGQAAGRSPREIATEELGVDPRSTRARPTPLTRPKNAHLFDLVLDAADSGAPLGNDARVAVAAALGLLDTDGRWRVRVLGDVRRFARSDVLFAEAARLEGEGRARRADSLSRGVRDGDIEALQEMFAEARQAIVDQGGDPSQLDEVADFELHARERAEHWNALHPTRAERRQPKPVDQRRAWADLILRDAVNRRLRSQALDATDIAKRIGAETGWVEVWMKRPKWEGAVLGHTVWAMRTLRAK